MDNFYRENILDHFKNPRNFGTIGKPDRSFEEENVTCGDKIGMDIKFKTAGTKNPVIAEIKFHGEGCAVSMASASMLTGFVTGKNINTVLNLGTEDVLKLLGISLTPTRLKCALLPLEVLQKTVAPAKKSA